MSTGAQLSVQDGEIMFSRRALAAALTLCALGVAALAWCIAAGFEVLVPMTGERRTTTVGIYSGTAGSERDVTALVMAVAAASFSASLVVSAAVLPQIRRLKVPIMFALFVCAAVSAAGLFVLVLSF